MYRFCCRWCCGFLFDYHNFGRLFCCYRLLRSYLFRLSVHFRSLSWWLLLFLLRLLRLLRLFWWWLSRLLHDYLSGLFLVVDDSFCWARFKLVAYLLREITIAVQSRIHIRSLVGVLVNHLLQYDILLDVFDDWLTELRIMLLVFRELLLDGITLVGLLRSEHIITSIQCGNPHGLFSFFYFYYS